MRWILLIACFVTALSAQNLQERVQSLIKFPADKEIKRVSYDPFNKAKVVIKNIEEQKPQNKKLYVDAILNDKAFIEGIWRGLGDKVGAYEIVRINPKSVFVAKEGKILKLMTRKTQRYIKTREDVNEDK